MENKKKEISTKNVNDVLKLTKKLLKAGYLLILLLLILLLTYLVKEWHIFKFFGELLVVISPLVSITYSLDKIKDNRAQAFNVWLNKIINEIFLGPIECLVYMIFVFTAGAIMTEVPLLAIIMIISMGQGEKAIKNVLGLKAPRGITSFGIMALVLQPFKMMFRRPGGAA